MRRARAMIRARGQVQACGRCGVDIDLDAEPWHAGHVVDRALGGTDDDVHPEHPTCNMRAGGRLGAAIVNTRHTDRATPTMLPESARNIRPRW